MRGTLRSIGQLEQAKFRRAIATALAKYCGHHPDKTGPSPFNFEIDPFHKDKNKCSPSDPTKTPNNASTRRILTMFNPSIYQNARLIDSFCQTQSKPKKKIRN